MNRILFCVNFILTALLLYFAPPAESFGFLFKDKNKIYVNVLRKANEALGGKIGNFSFIDQDGKRFETREFAGKPFIITFIYTSCPDICPGLLLAVMNVIEKGEKKFGSDFRVLTVAFDVTNDTPDVLKPYSESFTSRHDAWKFVTMDSALEMRNFTEQFGFDYKKTDAGFDHLNLTSIVGKDGTIMAHFFGDQYQPESVLKALELVKPLKLDLDDFSLVNRFLLYCSYYDPATGEYKVDYGLIIQFAIQYVLAIGTIIFVTRKNIYSFYKKIFVKSGETT